MYTAEKRQGRMYTAEKRQGRMYTAEKSREELPLKTLC